MSMAPGNESISVNTSEIGLDRAAINENGQIQLLGRVLRIVAATTLVEMLASTLNMDPHAPPPLM